MFTQQNDGNIRFFSTLMIYQHIKETVAKIIEGKESFNKCKQFLLSSIFPHLPQCSELVTDNVCKAIAILVIVGKVTYWFESIDDLLQMANSSEENCLYALMILKNCQKELNEIKLKSNLLMAIKDQCIVYRFKIQMFICDLLLKIQNENYIPYTKNKEILLKHLLELTHSWIKFKLNILAIPNYPLTLFTSLVKDNRRMIAEMLSESFQCSSTSLKALRLIFPNCNLKEILDTKIDKKELNIITQIIMMINNLVINYSNKKLNDDEAELLFFTASIFSSLSENYIYLFFINSNANSNSNISEILIHLFLFFISNSKRKISYLFFDSITELNANVNNQSLISLLTIPQQETFLYFLFNINDAMLFHSRLKELKVNYELITKQDFTQVTSTLKTTSNIAADLDLLTLLDVETNNEIETEDISIQTYRKAAEEAFSDLFTIIIHNYQNGEELFLKRTGDKLITINNKRIDITNEAILQNIEYLKLVEVVLFSIRSIRYCFNQSPSMLLSFCNFLLKSQVIKNEKILISFIIFLDSISLFINQDKDLYVNCIQFLLSLIYNNNTHLIKIVGVVILNIIENSREYNQIVFNALNEFYKSKYYDYELNTICHLSEGIFKCFLCSPKEVIQKEIIVLGINILSPIEVLFKSTSLTQSFDRNAFLKALNVYSIIIKYIGKTNKDILQTLYSKYASLLFNFCEKIISVNLLDNELITTVIGLFIKSCSYLKEHCLKYFDQINNVIYSIYSRNNQAYNVIYLMKALYNEALKNSQSPYAKIVIEKFCLICNQIYSNINSIEKNSLETTQLLASFISLLLDNITEFHNNSFDWDIMSKVNILFLECNQIVCNPDVNGNIIRAFRKILHCKGIPINFKQSYLKQFICCVMTNFNHYGVNLIKDISLLLIEGRKCDQKLFEEGIKETIENKTAIIVTDYFNCFYNEKDKPKIEQLIEDLIKIKKQEVVDSDIINKYAIELKALHIKTNTYN